MIIRKFVGSHFNYLKKSQTIKNISLEFKAIGDKALSKYLKYKYTLTQIKFFDFYVPGQWNGRLLNKK